MTVAMDADVGLVITDVALPGSWSATASPNSLICDGPGTSSRDNGSGAPAWRVVARPTLQVREVKALVRGQAELALAVLVLPLPR